MAGYDYVPYSSLENISPNGVFNVSESTTNICDIAQLVYKLGSRDYGDRLKSYLFIDFII